MRSLYFLFPWSLETNEQYWYQYRNQDDDGNHNSNNNVYLIVQISHGVKITSFGRTKEWASFWGFVLSLFFKMLRIKDSGKAPEQNDIKDETWSMNRVQWAEEEETWRHRAGGRSSALDAESQLESVWHARAGAAVRVETRSKWLFRPVKEF